jgi:hypothetical protein
LSQGTAEIRTVLRQTLGYQQAMFIGGPIDKLDAVGEQIL